MPNNSRRPQFRSSETVPLTHETHPADINGPIVGNEPRMLVLDEDNVSRRVLVVHFRARGWHVASASDVKAAIDLAFDQKPQVVVLDLEMRDLDAKSIVRTLRTAIEQDICVIGAARASSSMSELARQIGVEVVLPKPLEMATVDEFLGAKMPA
jgi:DNA-binding response OmpR family regulator